MPNNALVSIVMATYNGEAYLEQQLNSIMSQTHLDIEIIINDDDSSDNTISIVKNLQKRDERIKLFQNKTNLGFARNFEKAISHAKGEYIALADQDDIWLNDKIEKLLSHIKNNLMIHSDASLIDQNNHLFVKHWKNNILTHKTFKDFLYSNVVTGCTVLFKKTLLENLLPFPSMLAYHDWYLAAYAAKQNKLVYLNQPLTLYRQHNDQDTGAQAPNILKALIVDKIKRLFGYETYRMTELKKQLNNLKAIKSLNLAYDTENEIIDEAIKYFDDYLNHFFHIKMFLIGCKNRKHIYFRSNFLFIKNILNDLVG